MFCALLSTTEYGHAFEAARALGADNLVAVRVQMRRANMLTCYFVAAPAADAPVGVLAAYRAECIALMSGAVEALERRRVAGTLLPGKCSATEEAWQARLLQLRNANMPAAEAASQATLVGYQLFMHGGVQVCVSLDTHARMLWTVPTYLFSHLLNTSCTLQT